MEDPESGYGYGEPEYNSRHFCAKNIISRLYFLHELYEDILKHRTPEEVDAFINITKKRGVNMYPYIKSWIEYKENKLNFN